MKLLLDLAVAYLAFCLWTGMCSAAYIAWVQWRDGQHASRPGD